MFGPNARAASLCAARVFYAVAAVALDCIFCLETTSEPLAQTSWGIDTFLMYIKLASSPLAMNGTIEEERMMIDKKVELEVISRRRAFSFLGLAVAAGLAIPATVLTVTDADAQTQGQERRDDRQDNRTDRRDDRRKKKKKKN